MKRILFIPPLPWYMENHVEYLIRYLSDEFFIEVADVPYPPYENFLNRFPETHPLQRNPDDYDLLVPLLATHWVVTEKEKYRPKIAEIWYQPNEADAKGIAGLACATEMAEQSVQANEKYFSVRFGIDSNLFSPLHFKKDPSILTVGMVGNLYNPRRMTKDVIEALKDVDGVRLLLFVNKRPQTPHDLDLLGGGMESMNYIAGGEKGYAGLPNVYNRLDVLIRCDSDPGYSFPVLEAASCGVPVIATDSGIDHIITKRAEGGILIKGNRQRYLNDVEEVVKDVRNAVIFMRDHKEKRLEMGENARSEIMYNWNWGGFLPQWREFLRESLRKAGSN